MKYKYLIIIGFSILFLIIIISSYIFINNSINLSPISNQNKFCSDLDGKLNIYEQTKSLGLVLQINKDCSWKQLNKLNSSFDFCNYMITYTDYCLSSNILREKICVNNSVSSLDIECNCNLGVCDYKDLK